MKIWKDVKGYEGYYKVSSKGEIARVFEDNTFPYTRILTGRENKGTLRVALYKNKTRKDVFVHRVVAEAFVPNRKNRPLVVHFNGIKTHNVPSNLVWMTHKEKAFHVVLMGKSCIRYKDMSDSSVLPEWGRKMIQEILDNTSGTTISTLVAPYRESLEFLEFEFECLKKEPVLSYRARMKWGFNEIENDLTRRGCHIRQVGTT